MTYAPASLRTLASYWKEQGGVNLGIVGDAGHAAKGYSYHLGRDQLAVSAYSRQTARDKAGLSEAASAIDIGRLDGTLVRLRTFSLWLVGEGRRNAHGTVDIREIIYSPDGKVVLRWDRERGYASAPRPGEADNSHLTHTHISYYRDSEARDKVEVFRGFFEQESTVKVYRVPNTSSAIWPAGTPIYPGPAGPASGKTRTERRYQLQGQDRETNPTRFLVDGGVEDGEGGAMSWLAAADGMRSRRAEAYNDGVLAAEEAVRKVLR